MNWRKRSSCHHNYDIDCLRLLVSYFHFEGTNAVHDVALTGPGIPPYKPELDREQLPELEGD